MLVAALLLFFRILRGKIYDYSFRMFGHAGPICSIRLTKKYINRYISKNIIIYLKMNFFLSIKQVRHIKLVLIAKSLLILNRKSKLLINVYKWIWKAERLPVETLEDIMRSTDTKEDADGMINYDGMILSSILFNKT